MSAAQLAPRIEAAPAPPLRVALVHASDLGGGAERSVLSLHRGLRALGHDCTLFVGERRTGEPGVVEIPYVRGLPGSRRAARWLERNFGLQDIYNPSFRGLRQLLRGAYDIVHFNSLWGSGGFADISALPVLTRDIPGVITMRDNWLLTGHCACFHQCTRWQHGCGQCPDLGLAPAIERDGTRMNWRIKRRALAKSSVHVVAISDWLLAQARISPMLRGIGSSRVYNGIDLEVFRPVADAQRMALRAALGCAPEDFVVLLAGQTVEGSSEGIATHHAVAALQALPASVPLRPLVVGHSSRRVADLLGPRAIAIPFQNEAGEMARLFQAADATLVASEVEAFGRIAAESQACGTPVVAFAIGGIPEVAREGEGGSLCALGDAQGLARGLTRLFEEPEFRRQQARAGLESVRSRFGLERITQEYVELYRRVLATGSHG
jgi:glycosyltransferase involved in cell wall biosynthesis